MSSTDDRVSQVIKAIHQAFQAGIDRNFSALNESHLYDDRFSKFFHGDDYLRENAAECRASERHFFENVEKFDFEIVDPKVSFFDSIAVSSFYFKYWGQMEHQAFQGTDQVTMVFYWHRNAWRIVHEHFSIIQGSNLESFLGKASES